MQATLMLLGGLVVAFVFVDMLRVTMGEGSGVMTKRVTSWLWKAFLRIQRRYVRTDILTYAGIVIILMSVVLWIVLLWAGWMAVFSAGERTVVHAQTQIEADFWERIYFTGFTIFTLGTGDFVPNGDVWRVLTALAAASGLFLVTLSISYLIPVIQAFTQKRQLAVQIASLGQTPDAIILRTYDGSDWQALGDHLVGLTNELAKLEQRHLTYPMLHYFHSRNPTEAVTLSVAALDEALTIIQYGIEDRMPGLESGFFQPARRMITNFLGTLDEAYIEPASEMPPLPDLEGLRERGIPVVDEATFRARLDNQSERRRLLLALVENEGWAWHQLQTRGEGTHDEYDSAWQAE